MVSSWSIPLDIILGSWLQMALLEQEGWTRGPPEISADLSYSLIVWLWCAMNHWCKTPLRLAPLSPALKGWHVGGSAGSLWRSLGSPPKAQTQTGPLEVSGSLSFRQCRLLSHFALNHWLPWWTTSHLLLFSRKHPQNSENELFWFGGYLQLQKARSKCHAWDNWFPRKTCHLAHKPLVHFTAVTLLFFCCDGSSFISLRLTSLAQNRSDVVSFPHCLSLLPLPSKSHLSERTRDSITNSEANTFTLHWHGSVQSVITTLWLPAKPFLQ